MRKVITDAQDILARYIVPDSGISDHECINQLLGLLDGQQTRDALRVPEQPSRDAVPDLNVKCPECEGIIGNFKTTSCITCHRLVIEVYRALKSQPAKRNTSIRDEIATPEGNAMLKELRLRSQPAETAATQTERR